MRSLCPLDCLREGHDIRGRCGFLFFFVRESHGHARQEAIMLAAAFGDFFFAALRFDLRFGAEDGAVGVIIDIMSAIILVSPV